jgi:hypothetical protein
MTIDLPKEVQGKKMINQTLYEMIPSKTGEVKICFPEISSIRWEKQLLKTY